MDRIGRSVHKLDLGLGFYGQPIEMLREKSENQGFTSSSERCYHLSVLKKELFTLIQPLLPRCHSLAMSLIPDELQAEQLVIDAFTQCVLKEKQTWLLREWDEHDKKAQMAQRKLFFKSLVRSLVELGVRRTTQVSAKYEGQEFKQFYQMDTRTRAVAWLRFQQGWPLDEIERALNMKRHEVIEKVHNARFLLMGQPPHWIPSEARV